METIYIIEQQKKQTDLLECVYSYFMPAAKQHVMFIFLRKTRRC
jgi:hypothetical protein